MLLLYRLFFFRQEVFYFSFFSFVFPLDSVFILSAFFVSSICLFQKFLKKPAPILKRRGKYAQLGEQQLKKRPCCVLVRADTLKEEIEVDRFLGGIDDRANVAN